MRRESALPGRGGNGCLVPTRDQQRRAPPTDAAQPPTSDSKSQRAARRARAAPRPPALPRCVPGLRAAAPDGGRAAAPAPGGAPRGEKGVPEGWPDCGVPAARFVTGHGARSEVSAAVSFSAAQRVKFSPSGRRTGCPSAPLIALGLDCSFGACWRCPGRRAGSPCQCLPALTATNPVLLRA